MPKHTVMTRLKEVQARLRSGELDLERAAPNEVMTSAELAALLGIPASTLAQCLDRFSIPRRRLGRRLLFHRPAIKTWLSAKLQERVWIDPHRYPREAALATHWIRE
jgi:excisionase family DNA binding protein